MAIGSRVPIQFKELTQVSESGASRDEVYNVVADDYAKVIQRKASRNPLDNSTGQEIVYVFSEIRERPDFTPTKTMLISHKGIDLVITDIVLNENDVPHYYVITAETNR